MKNKKYIYVSLIGIILLLLGVTYSWWAWNSSVNTDVSLTIQGATVTFDGGSDIVGANLIPVSSKEVGIAKNVAIEKNISVVATSTTYMDLNLTLESFPAGLKSDSFVYELYSGSEMLANGNFMNNNQGEVVKILTHEKIESTTKNYKLYIYIDGNKPNPSSMMNQNFKFVLSANGTDNKAILTKEFAAMPSMASTMAKLDLAGSVVTPPNYVNASWGYADKTLFSDSVVSRIDVPIRSVANLENPYFTVYVVKSSDMKTIVSENKIYLPVNQLGGSTTVNKIISITGLNINVGEDETLVFGKATDTATWLCSRTVINEFNGFYQNAAENPNSLGLLGSSFNLLFDVYIKKENTLLNNLSRKRLSILGDSISTYAGISDDASLGFSTHTAWYKSSNITSYNMTSADDTWWMQTINNNNMTLAANNSWGGAYVIDGRTADGESTSDPQNSGMIRAEFLGENPNIIAVFMGANDIIKVGANPGTFNPTTYASVSTTITDSTVFVDAYSVMVKRLQYFYGNADIFLFTLIPTSRYSTALEESYSNVIRGIANYDTSDNIYLVDLALGVKGNVMNSSNSATYLGADKIHPNNIGMDYITEVFEASMAKAYNVIDD